MIHLLCVSSCDIETSRTLWFIWIPPTHRFINTSTNPMIHLRCVSSCDIETSRTLWFVWIPRTHWFINTSTNPMIHLRCVSSWDIKTSRTLWFIWISRTLWSPTQCIYKCIYKPNETCKHHKRNDSNECHELYDHESCKFYEKNLHDCKFHELRVEPTASSTVSMCLCIHVCVCVCVFVCVYGAGGEGGHETAVCLCLYALAQRCWLRCETGQVRRKGTYVTDAHMHMHKHAFSHTHQLIQWNV